MKTHELPLSEIQRGMIWAALNAAFSAEWIALHDDQQELVYRDFLMALETDDATPRIYRDAIGIGNLASYVRCLEIQDQRERRQRAQLDKMEANKP